MNPIEVRELFDQRMRRDPPEIDGYRIEKIGTLVRLIGSSDHTILYSRPRPEEAAHLVAAQVADLKPRGQTVEWKVYSHDQPPELPGLLALAGFVADPSETLMAFDLRSDLPDHSFPERSEVREIRTEDGFRDLVAVDRAAFGRPDPTRYDRLHSHLADPRIANFVAYLKGKPVASGRVQVEQGRPFAGLFGGGTIPRFRRRGIYHRLLSVRAEFARKAGARYLLVEAVDTTSRPILEKAGFVPLAGVVGWVLEPNTGSP